MKSGRPAQQKGPRRGRQKAAPPREQNSKVIGEVSEIVDRVVVELVRELVSLLLEVVRNQLSPSLPHRR